MLGTVLPSTSFIHTWVLGDCFGHAETPWCHCLSLSPHHIPAAIPAWFQPMGREKHPWPAPHEPPSPQPCRGDSPPDGLGDMCGLQGYKLGELPKAGSEPDLATEGGAGRDGGTEVPAAHYTLV